MKFDCGETALERAVRLGNWHRWFAWHPVFIADHDCRWLEYVERRIVEECGYGGTVTYKWHRPII